MTGAEHRAHEDVDHAQVAFHPPILLLGFLGLGFVLRWLIPTPFLPNNVATIVGPLLVLAALALFAWAVIVMRRGDASVPTGEPTKQLVFTGPFRVSRNPIYLSMVSVMIGTAIWSNCAWFLGLAGATIVLLSWGVITREERYLERKFGEPYMTYKRTVRRWC